MKGTTRVACAILPIALAACGGSQGPYTVGGTASGLVPQAAGSELTLSLNGGAALPVAGNGAFSFPGPIPDGASYAVAIVSPPGRPAQTCTISGGTGTVSGGNVASVVVTCTPPYTFDYAISIDSPATCSRIAYDAGNGMVTLTDVPLPWSKRITGLGSGAVLQLTATCKPTSGTGYGHFDEAATDASGRTVKAHSLNQPLPDTDESIALTAYAMP